MCLTDGVYFFVGTLYANGQQLNSGAAPLCTHIRGFEMAHINEHPGARALAAALAVVLATCLVVPASAQTTRQEHVRQMSHDVMPFDMSKTVHIFKMTEQGGVERVVTRKGAGGSDQVALIQQHLHHEAGQFQKGNYSDPAKLHGVDMPGLKDLEAGASYIKVTYAALRNGAEITFTTTDIHLLTAIHRWFGAQLSEHGADAKPE
ncbi:MAG: hypothetical protein WB784_01150 [Rhodanobacteraceae bacterium]